MSFGPREYLLHIGEAVKKLPPNLLATEPQIPWHSIARMRDRLIHGYFAVDYELVWDVVTSRIPDLRAATRRLLDAAE